MASFEDDTEDPRPFSKRHRIALIAMPCVLIAGVATALLAPQYSVEEALVGIIYFVLVGSLVAGPLAHLRDLDLDG